MRSAPFALLLALGLQAFPWAGPIASQEFGAILVSGTSSNPELSQSNGMGIVIGVEAVEGWLVEGSYQRVSHDTYRPGTVCVIYEPRMGCGPDQVRTSTHLGGTRVSVQRAFRVGDRLRLGVGGGGSFTTVASESVGDSGRRGDINAPKTGQLGGMLLVSGRLKFFESIPLALVSSLSNHWVGFKACATNPYTYDPYCGVSSFLEIGVGAVFVF